MSSEHKRLLERVIEENRIRHDHAYPMEFGDHHCAGCDLQDEIIKLIVKTEEQVMVIHMQSSHGDRLPLCWDGKSFDLTIMTVSDVDKVTCLDCLRMLARRD